MPTNTKRNPINLFEQVLAAPTGRVDRAAGVIRGVKILGAKSRNGRIYSDNALRQAAQMYEGIGVNINHVNRATPNAGRQFEEGVGWLKNVKVKGDAVYGDLHIIKSHPLAESIFEVAERNPRRFGLSHQAKGYSHDVRDGTLVDEICNVRSVDIVQNPASTMGLFESYDGRRNRRYPDVRKICRIVGNKRAFAETKARAIMSLFEALNCSPDVFRGQADTGGTGMMHGATAGDDEPITDASLDVTQKLLPILLDDTLDIDQKVEKIRAVLEDQSAILSVDDSEPVAKGADEMLESYNGGYEVRFQRSQKTASQRDGERKARIQDMLRRYR